MPFIVLFALLFSAVSVSAAALNPVPTPPEGRVVLPDPLVNTDAATVFNDRLLFLVDGNDGCISPWFTDGTAEGTGPLAAALCLAVSRYFIHDDSVQFIAIEADQQTALWRTHGTPATTERITGLEGVSVTDARSSRDRIYAAVLTQSLGPSALAVVSDTGAQILTETSNTQIDLNAVCSLSEFSVVALRISDGRLVNYTGENQTTITTLDIQPFFRGERSVALNGNPACLYQSLDASTGESGLLLVTDGGEAMPLVIPGDPTHGVVVSNVNGDVLVGRSDSGAYRTDVFLLNEAGQLESVIPRELNDGAVLEILRRSERYTYARYRAVQDGPGTVLAYDSQFLAVTTPEGFDLPSQPVSAGDREMSIVDAENLTIGIADGDDFSMKRLGIAGDFLFGIVGAGTESSAAFAYAFNQSEQRAEILSIGDKPLVQQSLEGLWAAASGNEGIVLKANRRADGSRYLFAGIFSYSGGVQAWLAGNTDYTQGSVALSVPLIRGEGEDFFAAGANTTSESAGTMRITPSGCNTIIVEFLVTDMQARTVEMRRLPDATYASLCIDET